MTKKKVVPMEELTGLEAILHPDFSDAVKDGKFDAVHAFESHINVSVIFLHAAMALLGDNPQTCEARYLLESFETALERGIEEAYRVEDPVQECCRERENGKAKGKAA